MFDRHEARSQAGRFITLRQALGHVARDIGAGLDALTRVQFSRPWERMESVRARHVDRR